MTALVLGGSKLGGLEAETKQERREDGEREKERKGERETGQADTQDRQGLQNRQAGLRHKPFGTKIRIYIGSGLQARD